MPSCVSEIKLQVCAAGVYLYRFRWPKPSSSAILCTLGNYTLTTKKQRNTWINNKNKCNFKGVVGRKILLILCQKENGVPFSNVSQFPVASTRSLVSIFLQFRREVKSNTVIGLLCGFKWKFWISFSKYKMIFWIVAAKSPFWTTLGSEQWESFWKSKKEQKPFWNNGNAKIEIFDA